MFYRIVWEDIGNGKDNESWVVKLPIVIGRSHEWKVSINHESVSRAHCQLYLDGEGALCVRDMGSLNGTYVNDEKIQHRVLMPGDHLQLGSVVLRVEITSDTDHGRRQAKPVVRPIAVTQPMKVVSSSQASEKQNPQSPEKKWWQFWN